MFLYTVSAAAPQTESWGAVTGGVSKARIRCTNSGPKIGGAGAAGYTEEDLTRILRRMESIVLAASRAAIDADSAPSQGFSARSCLPNKLPRFYPAARCQFLMIAEGRL
jgi:hypothetical protein